MNQTRKIKISIIIVNYNNARYLKKSLETALNQTYENKEIIVIDDMSNDNSIEILKKYKKKIKFYVSKKKTKFGSYNQINCYYQGFKKSNGKYIFFLDSDDYYKIYKVKKVLSYFAKGLAKEIIFDLPILKMQNRTKFNQFIQKKFILSNWPRFTPQSCITIERRYAKKIFKLLKIKMFPTIWFDFRIATFSYLYLGKIFVLKEYLTYYRQLNNSASKEYKTFSKKWWLRRKEAHDFFSFISAQLKVKKKITLDKIITNLVNLFYK